jgi:nitrate reductase (cytochrome), electron transfer subunit
MDTLKKKIGKVYLVFAGLCILALPFIVLFAFSSAPRTVSAEQTIEKADLNFDHQGDDLFEAFDNVTSDYSGAKSSERTLAEYYGRRQYLGSPPFIPHKLEIASGAGNDCLSCHAKGGWAAEFKRHTPVTPHPEQTSCRQCHVTMQTKAFFVKNNWQSSAPPDLGRSYLPGGPPPISHTLQLRGNCIACHVGPGAVESIRIKHAVRNNCRQCHVPDNTPGFFVRKSEPK